ncbi:MAG: phage tail sheath C-terminal domain-containing protein [Pseudomonas sp.]
MVQALYPGVYVEEVQAGARPIAPLPTAVTAFVGYTLKGVANTPLPVLSYHDFAELFGERQPVTALAFAVQQFFANGGSHAVVVRVASAGNAQQLIDDGLAALHGNDFNLLVIPETYDMVGGAEAAVIAAGVALCEAQQAFYIVDAPAHCNLDSIAPWAHGISQSRNAATYFPAVRVINPSDDSVRTVAPSGTLAGIYARTDAERGIWKAPAGEGADLRGVVDLALALNDMQNGQINPQAVNVLRSFAPFGRVVWGSRTLRGSDAQADEYKYIPVRRLALFLERSLARGTEWAVFEANDEPLWAQLRLAVQAFMHELFRQGAFEGKEPREAYFVKCDGETTTALDRQQGLVNLLVGFAPLKPAEFVLLRIQQRTLADT